MKNLIFASAMIFPVGMPTHLPKPTPLSPLLEATQAVNRTCFKAGPLRKPASIVESPACDQALQQVSRLLGGLH